MARALFPLNLFDLGSEMGEYLPDYVRLACTVGWVAWIIVIIFV